MDTAICVCNVHKKFKVYFDKGRNLKERLLFRGRRHYEEREVLNGISFEIGKGEAVGIIGENGSGKSTMLKLLTRIMYPDEGSLEVKGRISALIELGAGFHPDMSGRENIYTNAAILGLTKKEIDTRLQTIINFSELGEFIDNPVRTYSSGMYMRLAFAVAINVDADVLLVDEILAVGDASFQAKCFDKLREVKANGTTIVIVSHSLGQIEQICDRSIWICDGKIQMQGVPTGIHLCYMDYMGKKETRLDMKKRPSLPAQDREVIYPVSTEVEPDSTEDKVEKNLEVDNLQVQDMHLDKLRVGNGDIVISSVKLMDELGNEQSIFKTGSELTFEIAYRREKESVEYSKIGMAIYRSDGVHCYGTNTLLDRVPEVRINEHGKVHLNITELSLIPGVYRFDIGFRNDNDFIYDYWRGCVEFRVYSDIQDAGIARQKHSWSFE